MTPGLAALGNTARGRNHICHVHPSNPRRGMVDSHIGPIHYGPNGDQEIDTAWLPSAAPWQYEMTQASYNVRAKSSFNGAPLLEFSIGAAWVTLQPRQLDWHNDRGDVLPAGTVQAVTAAVDDDELTWIGAYGAGRDFVYETQTARLAKKVVLASYASLPAPSTQILTGGNPVLRAQFQFDWNDALVTPFVDGVVWTGGGGAPVLTTANAIEFRDTQGNVVMLFDRPTALQTQAQENDTSEAPGVVLRVSRSGNNLLIEVRVPQPWLAVANYPVIIDPTLGDGAIEIAAGADDADEATTIVRIDGTPLINVDGSGEWNAWRWPLTLPACTVDVSYLTVQMNGPTLDEPDVTFLGLDTATPAAFQVVTSDISSRAMTTATVDWSNTNAGTADVNTSDLSTIFQELVDSYAPYSSGYIGAAMRSRANDVTRDTSIESYETSTTTCARLHLEYTETGGISINLAAAALTASGQTLDPQPGAVSKTLAAAALTASGQILDVQPGVFSLALVAAALSASGQALTVTPGAFSLALASALLNMAGQTITVDTGGTPISVNLLAAALTAAGQVLDAQPGTATVSLSVAPLSAAGQILDVQPGVASIALSAASLLASGQTLDPQPGAVSISLTFGALTVAGQTVTISAPAGIVVNLLAAVLSAGGQVLDVQPGAVSIAFAGATLTASGQTITISAPFSGQIIDLLAADLVAQGQVLDVQPGATSLALSAALLEAQGQALDVQPGIVTIPLNEATIQTLAQVMTISPGAVSVLLSAASLTASGLAITLPVTVIGFVLLAAQGIDNTVYVKQSGDALDATGDGDTLFPIEDQ
jgi:hypothetical protein